MAKINTNIKKVVLIKLEKPKDIVVTSQSQNEKKKKMKGRKKEKKNFTRENGTVV